MAALVGDGDVDVDDVNLNLRGQRRKRPNLLCRGKRRNRGGKNRKNDHTHWAP